MNEVLEDWLEAFHWLVKASANITICLAAATGMYYLTDNFWASFVLYFIFVIYLAIGTTQVVYRDEELISMGYEKQ